MYATRPKPLAAFFPRRPYQYLARALEDRRLQTRRGLRRRAGLGTRLELNNNLRKQLPDYSLAIHYALHHHDPAPIIALLRSDPPPAVRPHLARILDELEANDDGQRWRIRWRINDLRNQWQLGDEGRGGAA